MSKSGIILVLLGCLFLAVNFGLLEWAWLRQWWPLVLIGIGLWSMFGRRGSGSSRGNDKLP
jgi:Domain of unknown function (DUF5668)